MQVKKDELYQAILINAESIFFEQGFKGASLRQIAKLSKTTIGNLYHYFESKEALFEALVKGEYEGFIYLIKNHNDMENADPTLLLGNKKLWRDTLKAIIQKLSPIFSRRFYLLLNCSQGTRYEQVREEFLRFMKEHFVEHLKESESHCAEELGSIISEQVLSSILAIIRDYQDEEKKGELITEMLLFILIGVMGLMET